jgi:hypothetical protein
MRRRKSAQLLANDSAYDDGAVVDNHSAAPSPIDPAEAMPAVLGESRLDAAFVPEHAQLSIANLIIAGRLSIHNTGTGPLRDLKIRTTMISASEGQSTAIRQFHEDESRGHMENIGTAKAGEEIALTLEIQQPRAELQAFDWRERQFLAPIVLIHLSGKGPKGIENYPLTCLIGREGSPTSERMKPFHIDRGPRRFDRLGFRSIMVS